MKLSQIAQQKIADYVALLIKWNKTYNLTAITKPAEIQQKHIADSLAIAPYLYGSRLIDVGTGAGLPGIPLAITNPDKHFTLLDSNGKKTRFLTQVKQELQLTNVDIVQQRVTDYQPTQPYTSVISRAFATIYDMLVASKHLVCHQGRILAMKGTQPTAELQKIPAGFKLVGVHAIDVPGLNAQRCLVEFERTDD